MKKITIIILLSIFTANLYSASSDTEVTLNAIKIVKNLEELEALVYNHKKNIIQYGKGNKSERKKLKDEFLRSKKGHLALIKQHNLIRKEFIHLLKANNLSDENRKLIKSSLNLVNAKMEKSKLSFSKLKYYYKKWKV